MRRTPAPKLALIGVYFLNTRLLEVANFHWLKSYFFVRSEKVLQNYSERRVMPRLCEEAGSEASAVGMSLQILYFRWIS